ncbi:YsnF/AvaK domain-containing protein [Acetivibrio cellulolyticus]|uniref:YsnF/AvaK domain-containing protein n=1 Tax=Acetivibrio cellulolyticus TaxID=35830 RepID=UPI0001E2E750|nr:YsnF/AvaK domain-containing protein [Acetivibrio cellulolyticus]
MIKKTYANAAKLQLKEERLDISKKLIQTGEVRMHKEVLTEERSITVPVIREELVIEKKAISDDTNADEHTETIRIPISTERIEIVKHTVILEDVEVYKRKFQEFQHIEENLKKEKLNVKTQNNKV